ncbi:hypothetical protein GEV43_46165 [Actinomadura sp. J1-007]|nr:hypothetical protein [Actinomadura sp. J1-007]
MPQESSDVSLGAAGTTVARLARCVPPNPPPDPPPRTGPGVKRRPTSPRRFDAVLAPGPPSPPPGGRRQPPHRWRQPP